MPAALFFIRKAALFVALASFCVAASAQPAGYTPPAHSSRELSWVAGRNPAPVDESYRATFDRCDAGKCAKDPSKVKYLVRLAGPTPAVLYQSKMALDLDGGYYPCFYKAQWPNQCGTSFKYDQPQLARDYAADQRRYGDDWKIPIERLRRYFNTLFVNSDTVPYVVVPGGNDGPFSRRTGVRTGDVGVVVYRNVVTPVIVADRGPPNKLGEASLKVFDELGVSRCRARAEPGSPYCISYRNYSEPEGVTTILFPNTTFQPAELKPDTIAALVRRRALEHYLRLKGSAQ